MLTNKPIENPQIKTIIAILKPTQFKECLQNMLAIIGESDASQVLDAVGRLVSHTQGWKNVIRYRDFRFDQCFAEMIKQLLSAVWDITRLGFEMIEVSKKGMDHAVFISLSDGGLLSNLTDKAAAAWCIQGRKSALSSLNEFRKKAEDCLSKNHFALSQANSVISRWNLPTFEFQNETRRSDFDLDHSVDNEDWSDQFEHYYRQIDDMLNAFSSACEGAMKQLEFFTKGNFDQSVLKLKEQERAEYLHQQQLEKLEKQSVTITKDGKEHLFSIEWQKVENTPCDPDKISHIKTDGKIWLIVASIDSNDVFYRSEDGVQWQQVRLDTPGIEIYFEEIDVVNGIWIITNGERSGTRSEGFYYSSDAITWHHTPAPEASKLPFYDGHIYFEKIIYFSGLWLWCGYQRQEYCYTEEGLFSDSTKADTYRKIILYYAQTLDGSWQPWEQTPQLSEGVEVKSICSIPGKSALLAFCEDDWSYIRNKKKPESPPFVMYYGAAKVWRNCTWDGSTSSFRGSNLLANIGNVLVYFNGGDILTSDNGYEWSEQEITLYTYIDEYFPLKDFSLFTENSSSVVYVSQDAKLFKELMLEEGTWYYLTANEEGILGVYYANKHEETVLRVGRYVCRNRPALPSK